MNLNLPWRLKSLKHSHDCPLCNSESQLYFDNTYSCPKCFLVFKSADIFLSKEAEDRRYQSHQNTNSDQGYINFLNRLAIPLRQFLNPQDHLLDYGCGPYSQISKILEAEVLSTTFFDPLFFPEVDLGLRQFEVVTCTEVAEHFKHAGEDWDQLIVTLKPNGILGIMTQFYDDKINFKNWWYKNDPTHVAFYREETLKYLAEKYRMKVLYNDHRSVIIFQNG